MDVPVHAGGLFVKDLHPVHADISLSGGQTFGDDERQGDEPAGILGPAVKDRQVKEIDVVALENNLLAGRNLDAGFSGKEPRYGKSGRQHSQHVPQILGRRHLNDFPDPVPEVFQVFDPKGQTDPLLAAEQIGGDWKRRVLHILEKQGFSTQRAFGFGIGQFADLQNSGYGM